jgi:putative membrane protein
MQTAITNKSMSDKTAKVLTWIITIVVFGTVTLLGSGLLPKPPVPALVYSFPKMIAIINGTCSVILVCSFISIKAKKISLHKFFNYSAMVLSGVFLVLYITTHFFIPDTRFGDTNP